MSRRSTLVLALASGSFFAATAIQQAPGAIGPVFRATLNLSPSQVGLLTSAIWGGMILGTLPAGYLTDHFGERRMVAGGLGLMALLVLAASFAGSFEALFLLLLLASLGAAASAPGTAKAIALWMPTSRRGFGLGFGQAMASVGGTFAALMVPVVAGSFGWSWALRAAAIPSLLALIAFAVCYPRRRAHNPSRERLDLGALLRNRRFVLGTAFAVVAMGTLSTGTAYLTLDAHDVAGKSVVEAGAIYACFQLGGATGRLAWGSVSDRVRRRELVLWILSVMGAAACLLVAAVQGPIANAVFAALAFFLGVSINGFSGTYLTLITESVGVEMSGAALGISLTVAEAGLFGIPPLFGMLVAEAGFARAWTALAVWTLLATAIALLMAMGARAASAAPAPARPR